jgi:hypothetical protein
MLFRVVDIETVPDLSVWTPGKPKWELQPGMRSDAGCESWFLQNGVKDAVPCKALYTEVEQFPPAQAHRVVAIAWVDLDMQPSDFKTYKFAGCATKAGWSRGAASERDLISLFGKAQTEMPATLVTWNGRTFDLPVLAMRALHLGIVWEWYYDDRDMRYRYSDKGHCDLMDFLSDYGASRQMKLTDACHLVGLPGKSDMDGGQVAHLVLEDPSGAKHREHIARYCLQDAIQTAVVFLRTRYHLGILTQAEYHASLDTFAESPFVRDAITINWDKCRVL